MKCLDEGVDVPRSELAIFCASTGNPRQFIQRRGRVLRTHKDKRYAVIHDLVVIPGVNFDPECYELEKSLVLTEVKRVRDFALLSENCNDTLNILDDVLNRYQISILQAVLADPKLAELGEYTPTGDETVADALDSENATIRAVAMIIDGNENQYTPKEIYTQVSNYLTSSI